MPLEVAACLALSKSLNYALTPTILPVEDILCGVEKGIGALPEETAEEVQQETVRNLKGSCKPKDNLTSAEKRALQALKDNEALTVLPTDKDNVTVALDAADYNWKIGALLEDQAYRKLKKDPTESVECKNVLLLKKSSISEEVCQQLWLQGSRAPKTVWFAKDPHARSSLEAYWALIMATLHTTYTTQQTWSEHSVLSAPNPKI
jgi:hypothetical protein